MEKIKSVTGPLPVSFDGFELAAKSILDAEAFDTIRAGSGADLTRNANLKAFHKWQLIPRVLRDTSRREITTTLLGRKIAAPIMVAPTGEQAKRHPEGELGSARAACAMDIPMVAATGSSFPLEKIAAEMGEKTRWFQMRVMSDIDVTKLIYASFARRAKAAGYSAIVITVDHVDPDHGKKYPRYEFSQRHPVPTEKGDRAEEKVPESNYRLDPVFLAEAKKLGEKDGGMALYKKLLERPSVTWKDVELIRRESGLPVIIKGIVHPKDAELAVKYNVDGIVVSNHGGRTVDGIVGTLDALPAVVDAVDGRIPILLDGGIRTGADVVKALALGAKSVLVGRYCAWGLAVAGERGVTQVISNLMSEIQMTLAVCGCNSLEELDRSMVGRF